MHRQFFLRGVHCFGGFNITNIWSLFSSFLFFILHYEQHSGAYVLFSVVAKLVGVFFFFKTFVSNALNPAAVQFSDKTKLRSIKSGLWEMKNHFWKLRRLSIR